MAKHLVDENSSQSWPGHRRRRRPCAAAYFAAGLLSGVRVLFVPGNYLKNFRHIVRYFAPSSFVRHVSLICIIKERSSSQTFANGKKGERRRRRKKWRPIIKSTVGAPHNMPNKKALFTEETATDKRNRGIARDRSSGIRRGGKPTDHKGEIIIGFLAFVTIPSCTLATLNV